MAHKYTAPLDNIRKTRLKVHWLYSLLNYNCFSLASLTALIAAQIPSKSMAQKIAQKARISCVVLKLYTLKFVSKGLNMSMYISVTSVVEF